MGYQKRQRKKTNQNDQGFHFIIHFHKILISRKVKGAIFCQRKHFREKSLHTHKTLQLNHLQHVLEWHHHLGAPLHMRLHHTPTVYAKTNLK